MQSDAPAGPTIAFLIVGDRAFKTEVKLMQIDGQNAPKGS